MILKLTNLQNQIIQLVRSKHNRRKSDKSKLDSLRVQRDSILKERRKIKQ